MCSLTKQSMESELLVHMHLMLNATLVRPEWCHQRLHVWKEGVSPTTYGGQQGIVDERVCLSSGRHPTRTCCQEVVKQAPLAYP